MRSHITVQLRDRAKRQQKRAMPRSRSAFLPYAVHHAVRLCNCTPANGPAASEAGQRFLLWLDQGFSRHSH